MCDIHGEGDSTSPGGHKTRLSTGALGAECEPCGCLGTETVRRNAPGCLSGGRSLPVGFLVLGSVARPLGLSRDVVGSEALTRPGAVRLPSGLASTLSPASLPRWPHLCPQSGRWDRGPRLGTACPHRLPAGPPPRAAGRSPPSPVRPSHWTSPAAGLLGGGSGWPAVRGGTGMGTGQRVRAGTGRLRPRQPLASFPALTGSPRRPCSPCRYRF